MTCGLEKEGIKVEYVKVDEVYVDKQVEYDLLAIGKPSYMTGMSKSMKRFLEKLKTVDFKFKIFSKRKIFLSCL